MNKKIYSIGILVGLAVTLMTLFGCISSRINLVRNGTVSVERLQSKGNVYLSGVLVYQEGDELVVSGKAKPRNRHLPTSGHVDIAILSPKGEVIGKQSTSYSPRIIRRKSARRGSQFTARFSVIPPEASRVRLAYHAKKHSGGQTAFDCGKNAAVNSG